MRNKKRSVTIRDVAREAGVSVSTVSRILNEKDDVAEVTFDKVQDVIIRMGYASSLAARGMRSSETKVIGLILPDVAAPYCIEIMQGVNRAIALLQDYALIVYTTGNIWKNGTADQERRYVVLLNGSITDGVIVVTPAAIDFATDAPVVAIDPNNASPNCPAIMSTNLIGALDAMSYLTGLGHRRIGFITGRLELVSGGERLLGYKEGLAAAGIPLDEELIQIGDYTTEVALEGARALLSLPNRPTAIFASNDMTAMGVYQAAREAGLCIPQDISVIGFDNLRESNFLNPPLTTVDQFISEMGSTAVNMLMKMIRGEPFNLNPHIIPTRLVVRDSCRSLLL